MRGKGSGAGGVGWQTLARGEGMSPLGIDSLSRKKGGLAVGRRPRRRSGE